MLVEGNTISGGGLTGRSVPLPTTARPLPQRARRTGLDWGQSKPDPDAIARLVRQGHLTVTEEVIEDKRVVRKTKPPKRKPGPKPGTITYGPRTVIDEDGLAEAYLNGAGLKQLAREHHVHHMTIRKRLVNLGVEIRPSGGSGQTFDVERARALRQKGLSYAAIARTLGFSERAVRNHIGRDREGQ